MFQFGQLAGDAGQRLAQRLRAAPVGRRQRAQQRAQGIGQGVRRWPVAGQQGKLGIGQGVNKSAPVVAHCFVVALAVVLIQGFVKQIAAVQRVFAQHAQAPAVDGGNRRVVEQIGRQRQADGRLLAAQAVVGVQAGQQAPAEYIGLVHRCVAAQPVGQPGQAQADALAQLAGGGLGKGHHQNLAGRQGRQALRRVGVGVVAQHQAHVQRRQGVGFAGAGAGFNQPAAGQRQGQRVKWLAHAASGGNRVARSSGR